MPQQIIAADVDERPRKGELPRLHALRLAAEKARSIAAQHPHALVLAADTVVGVGRRILPKAENDRMVEQCLSLLSGRRHQVITAVALLLPDGKQRIRAVTTRVFPFSPKAVAAATRETITLTPVK